MGNWQHNMKVRHTFLSFCSVWVLLWLNSSPLGVSFTGLLQARSVFQENLLYSVYRIPQHPQCKIWWYDCVSHIYSTALWDSPTEMGSKLHTDFFLTCELFLLIYVIFHWDIFIKYNFFTLYWYPGFWFLENIGDEL